MQEKKTGCVASFPKMDVKLLDDNKKVVSLK